MMLNALFRVDVRVKHRTINNAIAHLLNKALPQRCQIRNLKEIVIQYMKLYPPIRIWITQLANSVGLRHIHGLMEQQRVLFALLKLFVVQRVSEIPPIHAHMQQRCDWNSFSCTIHRTCARIKLVVQSNYEHGLDPLHGIESAVMYMTRVQPRNILQPCMMTLLRQLCMVQLGGTQFVLTDHAPLRDARTMLSTRLFENYGMSTQAAYSIRSAFSDYLRDANKNLLHTRLATLSEHSVRILVGILKALTQRRILHTLRANWESDITLCICRVCHEVKNTLVDFTSLRDIVYDCDKNIVCCVKKRSELCRSTPLMHICMNKNMVVVKGLTYVICSACRRVYTVTGYPNGDTRCRQCS